MNLAVSFQVPIIFALMSDVVCS